MKKNCHYCGNLIDAKHPSRKFCDDNCKMNFHRKGASPTSAGKFPSIGESATPQAINSLPSWVAEVELFCSNHNCTPEDLMVHYKGKPAKTVDRSLIDLISKSTSNVGASSFLEQRRANAMGTKK